MFPSWCRKIAALAALIPLALWGCGTNTSNVRSSSKDDARVAGASDAVRLITDGLTVVGNGEAWTYTTKEGIKLPSANTNITVRYGVPKETPDSDFKCNSLAANLVVSTDDNGLLNFTFPVTRGVDYEVGYEKGPWWLAPSNSEAPLVGFCLEDPAGKTVAWGGYGPQNEFSRLQPSLGLVAGINTLADYANLCATQGLGYVANFNCMKDLTASKVGPLVNGRCERPNWLNGDCINGDERQNQHRFGKIKSYQTLNAAGNGIGAALDNVITLAACRKRQNSRDMGDPIFHDINVISYNPANGATCFFNSTLGINRNGILVPAPKLDPTIISRTQVLGRLSPRAPAEGREQPKFWLSPAKVEEGNCISCHDNDPFMYSPYLDEASGAPHSYWPTEHAKGKYYTPGMTWLKTPTAKVRAKQSTAYGQTKNCFGCHRISSGLETQKRWIKWTTWNLGIGSQSTNPPAAVPSVHPLADAKHRFWMGKLGPVGASDGCNGGDASNCNVPATANPATDAALADWITDGDQTAARVAQCCASNPQANGCEASPFFGKNVQERWTTGMGENVGGVTDCVVPNKPDQILPNPVSNCEAGKPVSIFNVKVAVASQPNGGVGAFARSVLLFRKESSESADMYRMVLAVGSGNGRVTLKDSTVAPSTNYDYRIYAKNVALNPEFFTEGLVNGGGRWTDRVRREGKSDPLSLSLKTAACRGLDVAGLLPRKGTSAVEFSVNNGTGRRTERWPAGTGDMYELPIKVAADEPLIWSFYDASGAKVAANMCGNGNFVCYVPKSIPPEIKKLRFTRIDPTCEITGERYSIYGGTFTYTVNVNPAQGPANSIMTVSPFGTAIGVESFELGQHLWRVNFPEQRQKYTLIYDYILADGRSAQCSLEVGANTAPSTTGGTTTGTTTGNVTTTGGTTTGTTTGNVTSTGGTTGGTCFARGPTPSCPPGSSANGGLCCVNATAPSPLGN